MHRPTRLLVAAAMAVSATVPVALAGAEPATGGGSQGPGARADVGSRADAIRSATTVAGEALKEVRTPPPAEIVHVRRGATVALRAAPRGPLATRVGDTTEFGTPQTLGVVRRRGPWLGVTTHALPNGRLGWIRSGDAAIRLSRTAWSIHADVSSRRIVLRREGRAVRRLSVAVGRPGSPTPTGRFAVTDKISGDRFGPYYGCCILAISATQPNTPPGWTGGNRMAIHGTDAPSSIGTAASAGCLRAGDGDLQTLMRRVPVGTPVVVRP